MSRLEQIADLEKRFLLPTYNRYPLAIEKGKGVFLYDFEGNKYLDFVAGLGVNALGHAHPRIVKTIREQAAKVIHLSNLYYNEYQGQLAERLCQLSGLESRVLLEQRHRSDGRRHQTGASGWTQSGRRRQVPTGRTAGVVSRAHLRRDVAHRAGQVPQGIRAAARRGERLFRRTISKLCAPPSTRTPAPSCWSRFLARAESWSVRRNFCASAAPWPTSTRRRSSSTKSSAGWGAPGPSSPSSRSELFPTSLRSPSRSRPGCPGRVSGRASSLHRQFRRGSMARPSAAVRWPAASGWNTWPS